MEDEATQVNSAETFDQQSGGLGSRGAASSFYTPREVSTILTVGSRSQAELALRGECHVSRQE